MNEKHVLLFCALLFGSVFPGAAQSKRSVVASPASAGATRYFQLTMDLKSGPIADQQPTTRTISTELAVRDGRAGSCKARMTSQVPTGAGSGTKYIELGTKLDCNDAHIDGDALALEFALETSRIAAMIKTKGVDGKEVDEPLITQRTVQLTVKLPLGKTQVVFDSNSRHATSLKPLGAGVISDLPKEDVPMLIEMTAVELK